MEAKYQELRGRLQEISDLRAVSALLHWDQSTYMPPKGAGARARQSALVVRLAQEKWNDVTIGRLLDQLEPWSETLPYDSDEAGLIRVARRYFERWQTVPPQFVADLTAHGAASYQAWTKARPDNDFPVIRPYLEKTLDLNRHLADFFPGYAHIADPLIDWADDVGMTVATLQPLFAELRAHLVPLVAQIAAQEPVDDSFLRRVYPEAAQREFGEMVIRRFGYDFERGRQDKTHHPFMTKFSIDDVRITTRFNENDLREGLFATLHEAGHAMYEQGIHPSYEGTTLARGTSAGVHESQSRLWENVVGRGRPFWDHFYPQLQAHFPEQLSDVSLDRFYRAINRVHPSLIRVYADELTYNLHIMIRFDLENQLLVGELSVADLPDAWHARYQSDLGLRAPDDRDGVLQDMHWYAGGIGGMFQGYTLGNILSALFFAHARAARPEIDAEIHRGEFATLHGWLRENIYQHGSKYTSAELVERINGGPLSIEPYIAYLKDKFGALYELADVQTAATGESGMEMVEA